MAKANSSFSEVQIARRIKEGHGKDYIPWLTVQEVPSSGRSHRIYSHKTGRVHGFYPDFADTSKKPDNGCSDVRAGVCVYVRPGALSSGGESGKGNASYCGTLHVWRFRHLPDGSEHCNRNVARSRRTESRQGSIDLANRRERPHETMHIAA